MVLIGMEKPLSWSITNAKSSHLGGYFDLFLTEESQELIRNVESDCLVANTVDTAFPVTVNHEEYENSYVSSLYTAFVSYAHQEVKKVPNCLLKMFLKALIFGFDRIFKYIRINQVVQINNWMLSTNLYLKSSYDDLDVLTTQVLALFPEHKILFRSLNQYTNASIIKSLNDAGYIPIPTRQVYLFDPKRNNFCEKYNNKADAKLAARKGYTVVDHDSFQQSDFSRIEALYNKLYLDKYSQHNPAFKSRILAYWHQTNSIQYYGLRNQSGQLDAVVGIFEKNGVLTAPIVGYDTAVPQKEGLYRQLMSIVIQKSIMENKLLNLSSGASDFKQLRGGVPEIEFAMIYIKNQALYTRWIIMLISKILNFLGVFIMKRYKL